MPIQYIAPEAAVSSRERVLLDVRTPAEYADSHVPGALNLPLFSDEERVEVGTLYKQASPEAAFLRGLELVGPKMRQLVEAAGHLAPHKRVSLHCWRGGQRSGSVAWLLDTAGFDVQVVKGGYKAYRQWVREQFGQAPARFLIVGGPTGAGKTEILHALRQMGEQVIDLEGLAHHKGSSFGALGEAPQPSAAQFENKLWDAWRALDAQRPIWLENESRSIGRIYLPDVLFERMMQAPRLDVQGPLEGRLDRLVDLYAPHPPAELAAAFDRIGKRLGGQHLAAALAALEAGDYRTAAQIALVYYDKTYHHSDGQQRQGRIIPLPTAEDNPSKTAALLVALADKYNL